MVLVDTSIWISLYRKRHSELGQKLWALAAKNDAAVCGQVWVEFLGGFRKAAEREAYQSQLRAFPFLEATRGTYDVAVELLAAHPRLGAGDAIIAATAISNHAPLLTLDDGFSALVKHGLRLF